MQCCMLLYFPVIIFTLTWSLWVSLVCASMMLKPIVCNSWHVCPKWLLARLIFFWFWNLGPNNDTLHWYLIQMLTAVSFFSIKGMKKLKEVTSMLSPCAPLPLPSFFFSRASLMSRHRLLAGRWRQLQKDDKCVRARRLSGSQPFCIVCVLWSGLQGGSLGALSCEHVRFPSISRCLLSAAFLGRRQTFLGATASQNHMMNRCTFSRELNSPRSKKDSFTSADCPFAIKNNPLWCHNVGNTFSFSQVSYNSWCLFGSSPPSCFCLLQKSNSLRRKVLNSFTCVWG